MLTDQDMKEMELGLEIAELDMELARKKCGPNATHAEIMAEFDRLTDLRYEVLSDDVYEMCGFNPLGS